MWFIIKKLNLMIVFKLVNTPPYLPFEGNFPAIWCLSKEQRGWGYLFIWPIEGVWVVPENSSLFLQFHFEKLMAQTLWTLKYNFKKLFKKDYYIIICFISSGSNTTLLLYFLSWDRIYITTTIISVPILH